VLCDKGKVLTFKVLNQDDWDREIIKSEFAMLKILELQLEIPVKMGVSWLRTVEGLFDNIVEDLEMDQPVRKHQDPEGHAQIQKFIDTLIQ